MRTSHPAHAAAPAPAPAPSVPPGFRPVQSGGPYIEINGPLYLLHEGDVVKLGLRVEPRHANPMGIMHGGMTASFCDMLMPLSIHRKNPQVGRRFLPTISLQIDYLAPVPVGAWLEGTAELLRATRTLVFAQGLVTADGVPCARASGVFKIGPAFTGEFPD